jgi:hypothetical protein
VLEVQRFTDRLRNIQPTVSIDLADVHWLFNTGRRATKCVRPERDRSRAGSR